MRTGILSRAPPQSSQEGLFAFREGREAVSESCRNNRPTKPRKERARVDFGASTSALSPLESSRRGLLIGAAVVAVGAAGREGRARVIRTEKGDSNERDVVTLATGGNLWIEIVDRW
jgi:hypothetical protein